MVDKKDLKILNYLRKNSREKLTTMSRNTSIPVSTIYDRIKQYMGNFVKKHTAILDFNNLGFNTRANVILKLERECKEEVMKYMMKHPNVNSLYKINNGYDFMMECVFRNVKELEEFLEAVDDKFKVVSKAVYYIIDDLKREEFLSDPLSLGLVSV